MINKISDLICLGLQQKYCGAAGPIQEIELNCVSKNNIKIINKLHHGKQNVVDFVIDLIETKIIYADFEEPIVNKSFLDKVNGTLFYSDDKFEDIILDL